MKPLKLTTDGDVPWSFSKLSEYELCPLKYFHSYLSDEFRGTGGPNAQLAEGDRVHKSLAAAFTNAMPLPQDLKYLVPYVSKYMAGGGELYVEQKYALNKTLKPVPWFGPQAWYRGIADLVRLNAPGCIAVDWKTGNNVKPDSVQLSLMALCVLSYNPDIEWVLARYEWLASGVATDQFVTRETIREMWPDIIVRVTVFQGAHYDMNTHGTPPEIAFPPKPNFLCKKYCAVKSCIYNGNYGKRGTTCA